MAPVALLSAALLVALAVQGSRGDEHDISVSAKPMTRNEMPKLHTGGKVIELADEADFNAKVGASDCIIVMFYAEWCGHCKAAKPHFEKAAKELAMEGVNFARLDGPANGGLMAQYEIKRFPEFVIFRNGRAMEYKGEHKTEDFVKVMREESREYYKSILNAKSLKRLIPKKDHGDQKLNIVVGYFHERDAQDFSVLSQAGRDMFDFYLVTSEEVAKEMGQKIGDLVLYKPYDDRRVVFREGLDLQPAATFLLRNNYRWVDEITLNNYEKHTQRGLPFLWLLLDPEKREENEKVLADFYTVAKAHHSEIAFVTLDGKRNPDLLVKLTLPADVLPAMAFETPKGNAYAYVEGEALDLATIKNFVKRFKEGTLKETTLSAPVPANGAIDGVTEVVGDTAEEFLSDRTKDSVIMFYSTQALCHECDAFAQQLDNYAKSIQLDPILAEFTAVGKMDLFKNSLPKWFPKVESVPQIWIVSADKKVVIFDGELSVKRLTEWRRKRGDMV